jgi:hypothetical protein
MIKYLFLFLVSCVNAEDIRPKECKNEPKFKFKQVVKILIGNFVDKEGTVLAPNDINSETCLYHYLVLLPDKTIGVFSEKDLGTL